MAKAASKRPLPKAKSARAGKPVAKSATKAGAVKTAPKPPAPKRQIAKAQAPKTSAKSNGHRAANNNNAKGIRTGDMAKKLGSVAGRTPPPAAAPKPSINNSDAAMAAPVPTNNKPRKNQAGLHAKELEHFRDLLLAKRYEIVGDMSAMEREALRTSGGSNLSTLPIHMADMGTDNYEQEFTLGLVETERKLLREINHALAKIQNGTYGICEGTGKPISKARLEVQPWARYSIEYAKQMERAGR